VGKICLKLLPSYLWDTHSAPEGALTLSVAENKMIEDLIQPSVETFIRSKYGKFTNDEIYYQPTHGGLDLIESMASYLSNLLQLDLDPEGLTIGAGCNAVHENLVFCLTEANDGKACPFLIL